MKILKYITSAVLALAMTMALGSCMDGDWDDPTGDTSPYGNNSLVEKNVISIADLRAKYATSLAQINDTTRLEDGLQIKGVVTANDIEGNIYNQIAVDDGTGAIVINIAQGGLFGQVPIGQEILVDLTGLYIGTYRSQAQIGVPYTATSKSGVKSTYPSRMPRTMWNDHYKALGKADPSRVHPVDFDLTRIKDTDYILSLSGKHVTLRGVSFDKADGKLPFATEAEGENNGNGVSRSLTGYNSSNLVVRTSCYADFASEPLPMGKLNITGVLTCYRSNIKYTPTAQLALRKYADIEKAE